MVSDSPAAETAPARERSVAIVLTRRVAIRNVEAFETSLRELIAAGARQPGQVDAQVLRGSRGPRSQDYHIVYRFTDQAKLSAWEASAERRALLARVEALAADTGRRQLTGMEAWFNLPSAPPPSRTRMALPTWVGIWPLVSLALLLLAPRLTRLPFLARTATITALLVLAMTYLVMPLLTRLAAPWLQPRGDRPAPTTAEPPPARFDVRRSPRT